MRFSTVCFLFEIPPLQTYYERYDMHEFVQKGYTVIVYDMSPLINPIAYNSRSKGLLDENRNVMVKHIASIKELKEEVKKYEDIFFWTTIPLFSASYKIFRVISKYGYGFICNVDYVPTVQVAQKKDIKLYLKSLTWNRLKESVFCRIPRKYLPVRKADAILTYTDNNIQNIRVNALCDKNTRIELVNTLDYNEYARCKQLSERIVKEDYCLFIDQFIPFHPDGRAAGYNFTPQVYYDKMTEFLRRVGEITKTKVVIAAHPKANYELYPDYFSEFDIYKFKTCELVKNARLVISHASISLSFVVLFRKPLLLVATQEMFDEERLLKALENASESVQHELINVSVSETMNKLETIILNELDRDLSMFEEQSTRYRIDSNKYVNANKSFAEVMQECMESV